SYPGLSPAERDELADRELSAERLFITVSPEMQLLYRRCREAGKRVFFISDIYLPEAFMTELLSAFGLQDCDGLYVSSRFRLTKRTGRLFAELRRREQIRPGSWIHIGDSFESDFRIPRKMKIKAIHIPARTIRSDFVRMDPKAGLKERVLKAFINNHISCGDPYYEFGFACFGMFLWGYVNWIAANARRDGIGTLFFLSRDGFLMKEAFDICCGEGGIRSAYLEVSRRSLRVPTLWLHCRYEWLLDMLTPSMRVPLSSFFDGIGLPLTEYLPLAASHGFEAGSCFERKGLSENEGLRALFEELRPAILENSKKEFSLLSDYLKEQGVGGRFGIVDIGWSGSMQRFLLDALDELGIPASIKGYYVGLADYYKRNEKYRKDLDLSGYLFDFKKNPKDYDCRQSFVGLFETLFPEQKGSVERYEKHGSEGARAVRLPYEYASDGRSASEKEPLEALQRGALDFCRQISAHPFLSSGDFSPKLLFRELYHAGTDPSGRMLAMFGDFRFIDEKETSRLAAPKALSAYIRDPGSLRNDFLKSRWKTGFLKRLFKVKLPYQKLYLLMRRLK
ncbi:MAG: hypothetical protein K6E30_07160, partial [Lachnospiraceae bacterium]|nr:hypothetical protein [Lachnospiraceae bacterium]